MKFRIDKNLTLYIGAELAARLEKHVNDAAARAAKDGIRSLSGVTCLVIREALDALEKVR